jgi:hypothetical protein
LHSRRRHGWRRRRLQDYPAHGDEVTVDLAICRWRCQAPACPRRTFSDQIASIARPFARRTSRVGEIVTHLGHATGGRPAERLLHRLGLGVSDDTVLGDLHRGVLCALRHGTRIARPDVKVNSLADNDENTRNSARVSSHPGLG